MAATTTASTTAYHAKLYATQLARRVADDSTDKLASSLADALVDLNPHQIDAALFAFQSPLSQGVILADEVGLGKTIEAGLVVSQFWAERKRHILVVTPANLRKQWMAELESKFHLPCAILEGPTYYQALRRDPRANPFDQDGRKIVIVSIPFASGKEDNLARIPWDLVVIDEAHRLRNPEGKQARRIKHALNGRHKLLLTATPLQNRTDELWGLASLIDEHFFGDRQAFRTRYGGQLDNQAFLDLRTRLKPLVQRTLRVDVREFISYTNRIPMLEEFTPTPEEQTLYQLVSEYLLRPNLMALPAGQRSLMTMMLRKLLASSTFAIAGALRTMANRLGRELAGFPVESLDDLAAEYDPLEETEEEWSEDGEIEAPLASTSAEQRAAMAREVRELEALAEQAEAIAHNAKVTALIAGLRKAFDLNTEKGAPRKAIVFSESRRTQQYLQRVLAAYPEFAEGLVLFDGTNNDQKSREIYDAWKTRHAGTDKVTSSRSADIRAALVDYFRDDGQIMLATEAAAEGINLQFCALVINYDLPWNPQRIEQRIGRCHRYGQEHDVVVVNFLNKDNEADQRVYELLRDKFHLFDGVFGASDEVLGEIGSGVDIERRIAEIYQTARTSDEINRAFTQMQLELSGKLDAERELTERKLFAHFDEDVANRFRVRQHAMKRSLGRIERMLLDVTRHELGENARFTGERTFTLLASPWPDLRVPCGRYDVLPITDKQRDVPGHLYRPGHPLAERVVATARTRELPPAEVVFSYGAYGNQIGPIKGLLGASGWLSARLLSIDMDAGGEDHLLLAGFADDGCPLDEEQADGLFRLPANVLRRVFVDSETASRLTNLTGQTRAAVLDDFEQRANAWFEQEQAKLDAWTEDRRRTLESGINDFDREIERLRRDLRNLHGQLKAQHRQRQQINELERKRDDLEERNRQRRREIEREKDELLDRVLARIDQSATETPLFTIRWCLAP